jgi:hypothetical protein
LFLTLLIILCVLSAFITILTFVLYVRARMAVREEDPECSDEENAWRLAGLDRREGVYRRAHFIMGFVFVVLGVIILSILSNRMNSRQL